MSKVNEVTLSEAAISRLNIGKKRKLAPLENKDKISKKNKDSGKPYKGRDGNFHPGILPPTDEKVCTRCDKEGCTLTGEVKRQLFTSFRQFDYNGQSSILAACVSIEAPRERLVPAEHSKKHHTYKYAVTVDGRKFQVCKSTLMDIFKVTSQRLRLLTEKMANGDLYPRDSRGTHSTRPHRIPDQLTNAVRQHISSFPTYESHYKRAAGDPLRKYLNPELTISKMYSLFIEQQRENDGLECEDWYYRHLFKSEFNLTIGYIKQDTCDKCTELHSRIADTNQREMFQDDLNLHQALSEGAYKAYQEDSELAKTDETYIVLTGDLQQVLFTPALTNSASFYLRKLSNYNYGIHNSRDNSGTMHVWDELTGKRGSNEVSSCFWDYCLAKFTPLNQGQKRTLTVWLDRCRGQNNNFMVITMLQKLVWLKYFTQVNQKFYVTGHSYNDCDRAFGFIEKQQRKHVLTVPSDIEKIIFEARNENPFCFVKMDRQKIKDFKYSSTLLQRPATLKVTHHLWFQYNSSDPSHILTRRTHGMDIWEEHVVKDLTGHELFQLPTFRQSQLRDAYPGPLKLEKTKLKDLKKLSKYLNGEALAYYENIIRGQEGRLDETNSDSE